MPGEDTPVQHKSSETVTDADVQRLLNIALAGAGVVEGLTPINPDRHHRPLQQIEYPLRQAVLEIRLTEQGFAPRLYPAGKAGPVYGLRLHAQSRRGKQVTQGRDGRVGLFSQSEKQVQNNIRP